MSPLTPAPVLQLRGIRKQFGGTQALDDVDLTVYRHEIHAVMGENGAGKSTLMKVLSGVVVPDAGEIVLDGEPVRVTGVAHARSLGVNLIHQELAIAGNLTVAQNIFLGSERRRRFGRVDHRLMRWQAQEILASLGTPVVADALCATLSIAEQQQVEIARALAHQGRILIMDEPTSSLSEGETERLFALIERLRSEGMAILYISHRMAEVDRLADRVTVLRDGHLTGTLARGQWTRDTLVHLMVGRPLGDFYRRHSDPVQAKAETSVEQPVALELHNVCSAHVRASSLTVRCGEILGLAGLVGAGRTELARLLFGLDRMKSGQMRLFGTPYVPNSPAAALRRRVAYLPEDRKQQGLFLELSVQTNLMVASLARYRRQGLLRGLLDMARLAHATHAALGRLAVRTPSGATPVGRLSGGNQQKVLLARLLEFGPRLLILDEPTRGVDIGAKMEIYQAIQQLADAGMPILFISSELPEIIGVADRVAVMRAGQIVAELSSDEITQENILRHATDANAAVTAAATTATTCTDIVRETP